MDTNDTDIMIKLLDKAMSSNSEEVKAILQNLLVSVSLIHADDNIALGPLAKILDQFNNMQQKLSDMSNHISRLENKLNDMRAPSSIYPTKRDTYDGYEPKWEENNWDNAIKRLKKSKSILNNMTESKSKMKSRITDDDTSSYSSIKNAITKFALNLK
jgi:hypothetical protein